MANIRYFVSDIDDAIAFYTQKLGFSLEENFGPLVRSSWCIWYMPTKKPGTQPAENGLTFKVRVQPKASQNQVDGYSADRLRLRVTAPPQDGKANLAVISLLAESLGVPKSRLRIIRGHASREKLVEVTSITPEDLEKALNALGS